MKKKIVTITAMLLALLCLTACGSKKTKVKESTATLPTASQTEPVKTEPVRSEPATRDIDFYSGTWAVSGVNVNGADFTLEQAVAVGLEEVNQVRFVLTADGTAYLEIDTDCNSGIWELTEEGIQIDSAALPYQDNHLVLEAGENSIYFEKVSDDQTPPVPAEATEPETTEPETTAPAIRPEFKEAMDSYEAFYNEYCDLMAEYTKNPTDFTLLGKYAAMLSKAEEMDKKFEAWDEGDMSTEELKYYLDVTARVQKRMVDLF